MILTDEQWLLIQPIIASHLRQKVRGRPSTDDRLVLEGILWKITNNAPWYDLPSCYPSHQTCYLRYRQWQRLGLMPEILQTLYQHLLERGGMDIQQALRKGLIRIQLDSAGNNFAIAPKLYEPWQLPIVRLFLGMAVKKLRANRSLITE